MKVVDGLSLSLSLSLSLFDLTLLGCGSISTSSTTVEDSISPALQHRSFDLVLQHSGCDLALLAC
jgi:hypothetical protein